MKVLLISRRLIGLLWKLNVLKHGNAKKVLLLKLLLLDHKRLVLESLELFKWNKSSTDVLTSILSGEEPVTSRELEGLLGTAPQAHFTDRKPEAQRAAGSGPKLPCHSSQPGPLPALQGSS